MALLAFDGVVITLTGSRLRMKNLGHNFDLVRLLVYFLFCGVMTYPKMLCARGKKTRHQSVGRAHCGNYSFNVRK
jgi:hypothetical protein